jgi:uncharacterized protein YdhG (YjbR/CyaY superfamily)
VRTHDGARRRAFATIASMPRPTFASVDEYLAAQPDSARLALERVRATLLAALPGAEEGISYGIPVYRQNGTMILYFAGYKNHYAIYPATPTLLARLAKPLAKRLRSKATIGFSYTEEFSARLVARIAKVRAAEARAAQVARATKKAAKKRAKKTAPRKRGSR